MNKIDINDLSNLMFDTLYNQEAVATEFEGQNAKKAGSDAIRTAILDELGVKVWDRKLLKKSANREALFEIVETALGAAANGSILTDQLNGYVEVLNIPLGGTKAFTFDDAKLLDVSVIAPGHNEIDRQRITNGRLDVRVEMKSIAVYTEWEPFLAGQYDFDTAVAKTAISMANDTALSIWNVLRSSINFLRAPFKHTGPFDIVKLQEIVRDVSSLTGQPCTIMGTRVALAKISVDQAGQGLFTEAMLARIHAVGSVERLHGLTFGMWPDIRKPITKHNEVPGFELDDNFLLVVPGTGALVKVIREGQIDVYENSGMMRPDNQLDWGVTYREGVGAAIPKIWGAFYME